MQTTLTAERTRNSWASTTTVLKDKIGRVKMIMNNKLQLRKGTPTVTIRGVIYSIDWSKTEKL